MSISFIISAFYLLQACSNIILKALRESLTAKSSRCLTLQTELDRARDRPSEIKSHKPAVFDREELNVKERKIELLKGNGGSFLFSRPNPSRYKRIKIAVLCA